ncbi:hypothetical protein F4678DRAFT_249921 [Xylaria arbuscula]|nr:hypothetical protein F4678DRAFT_249921 [Xylaria arbuscula]
MVYAIQYLGILVLTITRPRCLPLPDVFAPQHKYPTRRNLSIWISTTLKIPVYVPASHKYTYLNTLRTNTSADNAKGFISLGHLLAWVIDHDCSPNSLPFDALDNHFDWNDAAARLITTEQTTFRSFLSIDTSGCSWCQVRPYTRLHLPALSFVSCSVYIRLRLRS